MKIPNPATLCEPSGVNTACHGCRAWLVTVLATVIGLSAAAQSTNPPAGTNSAVHVAPAPIQTESAAPRVESAPQKLTESAFAIVSERNVFNANRSGGRVSVPTRRPSRTDTFTLVGTMAYEKGAFAFFEGSSSEFTKTLKAQGLIAGYKLVDVLTDAVKIELDGKETKLPVGSQMRREDEGAWHVAEVSGGGNGGESSYTASSSRTSDAGSRSSRSSRGEFGGRSSRSGRSDPAPDPAAVDKQERKELKKESKLESKTEAEILKRLLERREKE
ncbi:MAG: hypothetical protein EXS35_03430 [Pedosphaera sp.]|nr:hypothetical protein [Pedosphaera sp.]